MSATVFGNIRGTLAALVAESIEIQTRELHMREGRLNSATHELEFAKDWYNAAKVKLDDLKRAQILVGKVGDDDGRSTEPADDDAGARPPGLPYFE